MKRVIIYDISQIIERVIIMTCTIISTGEKLNLVCKNEKEPPYPEIKEKLFEKIWELYCKGYDRF